MISFVTLFLGLVVGLQTVTLDVGDGVARVELRLDGEMVGTREAPPWTLDCDLGPTLEPRRLEAIAFDTRDFEVGRAEQWLNLAPASAEARLIIEQEGTRRIAKLTWESLAGARPERVAASFDGRRLEVSDPARIELPSHDPESLHVLRIELDFGGEVRSVVERALDGRFSGEVSTELTAVAIELERGAKLPALAALGGWLVKRGAALEVAAVEETPADVVVIPELGAHARLVELGRRRALVTAGSGLTKTVAKDGGLRFSGRLRKDQRLRFLWPAAETRTGARHAFETFPTSQELSAWDGGVFWFLARMRPLPYGPADQRLADAVAVAGLSAAGRNRRRAVVLLTQGDAGDASQFSAAVAKRYLASLRVPLRVWSVDPLPDASGWGEVVDVSTLSALERAVEELSDQLERQRIVFVRGLHRPQDVVLGSAARGVRLAR